MSKMSRDRERCRKAVRDRATLDGHPELGEEYIVEAEHQDGVWHWDQFSSPAEAVTDFLLYIQQAYDAVTAEELAALLNKHGKMT